MRGGPALCASHRDLEDRIVLAGTFLDGSLRGVVGQGLCCTRFGSEYLLDGQSLGGAMLEA